MTPKARIENNIHETYRLIQEYEAIQRDSTDPKEKSRASREIKSLQELLKEYLSSCGALSEALGTPVPTSIMEIAALIHFPLPQPGEAQSRDEAAAVKPKRFLTRANIDLVFFNELVALFTPYLIDQSDRRTLLGATLNDVVYSQINFGGSASNFTPQMITTLLQYGEVEPNKQAIIALLESLREQVGFDRQQEIDRLQVKLMAYFQKRN